MARASGIARVAALAALVAFGGWLRWRAANHPYISQWDEAYHALVARNMRAHPLEPTLYEEKVLPADDREWTRARVWLHKPPLPLWLMSAGIALFGEAEFAFRLPAVVLDTLAILLIYLLAGELFGRGRRLAGSAAAACYAVNPLMIRLVSGRIPDDTPHVVNVFFMVLTVLLFSISTRRNSRLAAAAAGLSLGLGTLCMSAIALLGLAAALPRLLRARGVRGGGRLLIAAVVPFAAAALPWPVYCLARWPELWRHESALQVEHLFSALDAHAHAWWWYLKLLPVHCGGNAEFVWASAAAALAYAAREAARGKEDGLMTALLWALLPYVFFSVIATKLYSYVCVAVPALCLLCGFGAASLWAARGGGFRPLALGALIALAAHLSTVASERFSADYSECPWNSLYDYPSFRRALRGLRDVPGPAVVLNVGDDKAPQAMYYSGAIAYPDAPSAALVRELLARGRRVYVLLDEEGRRADVLPALRAAGLDRKIGFISLPPPASGVRKHPYEA